MPEIQTSFLHPGLCPMSPREEQGDAILASYFYCILGLASRQPLPANPFSEPLQMVENRPVPGKGGQTPL